MKGKFLIKNTRIYSQLRSAITNLNISGKSSRTRYLKELKKYFSLFSQPLTPNNLIYSLSETALSFPISIKSYSLNVIKFREQTSLRSNIFDSNNHQIDNFISSIYRILNNYEIVMKARPMFYLISFLIEFLEAIIFYAYYCLMS